MPFGEPPATGGVEAALKTSKCLLNLHRGEEDEARQGDSCNIFKPQGNDTVKDAPDSQYSMWSGTTQRFGQLSPEYQELNDSQDLNDTQDLNDSQDLKDTQDRKTLGS